MGALPNSFVHSTPSNKTVESVLAFTTLIGSVSVGKFDVIISMK